MSQDWSSRGFAPTPRGAALPEYVAPARAFFGDDDATAAYLAQLEAYAADGAEATDLLDAAEAAGDVATAIALLEGGSDPTLGTYTNLQEVLDLIADGTLVEGQGWRIAWASDTYLGAGSVKGQVLDGKPYWRGLLPTRLFGTTLTAITGGYTLDGDGRPVLSCTGDGTSVDEVDLGFLCGPTGQIRLSGHYTSSIPSVINTGGPHLYFCKAGAETTYAVQAGLVFSGGDWGGYGFNIGNPFGGLSPVADFSLGSSVVFGIHVWRHPLLPQPRACATIQHGIAAAQLFDTGGFVEAGMGDWRTALDLKPRARLRDLGVAATYIITGLELIP